jgi:predicted RNase H-like HicB family nuclease
MSEQSTHSFENPKYLVLYERSSTGFGAYAPDLPGCIATGRTIEETRDRMTKAIEMHLIAMRKDGEEIPQPSMFELIETS